MMVAYPLAGAIALIVVSLLVGCLHLYQRRTLATQRIISESSVSDMRLLRRSRIMLALWAILFLCFVPSIAGVSRLSTAADENRCAHSVAMVDVSKSMDAEDASSLRSRKEAMQEHILALATACRGGTVGIISFGGFAGWRVPQTEWSVVGAFAREGRIVSYEEKAGSDLTAPLELIVSHMKENALDADMPRIERVVVFSDGGGAVADPVKLFEPYLQELPGVVFVTVGYGRLVPARIPLRIVRPKKKKLLSPNPFGEEDSKVVPSVRDKGAQIMRVVWPVHAADIESHTESYDSSVDPQVVVPKMPAVEGERFLQNDKGEYYTTTLNSGPLEALARMTKGLYLHESDPRLIKKIRAALSMDESAPGGSTRREDHSWFMFIALACLTSIIFLASMGGIKE